MNLVSASVFAALALAPTGVAFAQVEPAPAAVSAPPPAGSTPPPSPTQPPPTAAETPPPPPPAPPPVDADASIRAAYLNAENQQGPLDGRWRLTSPDGTSLFAFVIADTGGAPSPHAALPSSPEIEGAWRDLRREGGVGTSGLLISVEHLADTVEIRFYEADPAAPTVVKLHDDASGVWSGELFEAGAKTPVIMKRF